MLDYLWDFFVETLIALMMPMICMYHCVCGDLFLNVAVRDATGLEKLGNTLLVPYQYLFAGREVVEQDGEWAFVQRFEYEHGFWSKTISSVAALPASVVLGGVIKGLGYLDHKAQERYAKVRWLQETTHGCSNCEYYQAWGITAEKTGWLAPANYLRRPGEEKRLAAAKEGLTEVTRLLNEAGILWWVDCGTLLGTYRYGGVIPWDGDIDLAVLLPDFEHVRRTLNQLDRTQYVLQDWSGRSLPHTHFKVYIKKTGDYIDIDCFAVNSHARELTCIFSHEHVMFVPEWVKIRERRFSAPAAYDMVFPLKRSTFDGIEVFVPRNTIQYLQRLYGDDLAPAKIYNPQADLYEKDLSHSYWQRPHVH